LSYEISYFQSSSILAFIPRAVKRMKSQQIA
jgi:hypothetical protein